MTMVLGPDKKAQAAAEKKRSAPEESPASPSTLEAPVIDTSETAAPAAEALEVTPLETEATETAAAEIEVPEIEAEAVIAEAPEDSDTSET